MKNDPQRMLQEMADLQHILGLPDVHADEIRQYFEQQGLREKYDEFRRIFGAD